MKAVHFVLLLFFTLCRGWDSHKWRSHAGRGDRTHLGNDTVRLTRWSNTKNTSKLVCAKCDLIAYDRAPSGANPFTMSKDTFRVLFVFLGLGCEDFLLPCEDFVMI